ncbi:MAG: VTT domain-containing protein [Pseudomonadota bacterium]
MGYVYAPRQQGRTIRGKTLKALAAMALCGLIVFSVTDQATILMLSNLSQPEILSDVITQFGPVSVVFLLAVAVVVSPIPSGPIAMAAGALFGPVVGGSLTALGAVLGALIAFSVARGFGYQPISNSNLPLAQWITRPRTETALALVVLVSRLIPFISFDAVSYVAGLTTIRPWVFGMATSIGVLPASFAFAALGAGMATMDNAMLMIAACGVTAILPVAWGCHRALRARRR